LESSSLRSVDKHMKKQQFHSWGWILDLGSGKFCTGANACALVVKVEYESSCIVTPAPRVSFSSVSNWTKCHQFSQEHSNHSRWVNLN
jgi:hypothetical protein